MTTETTETRNRKRVNLTLAPATVAALGDVLNASRYVDRLVAGRAREWRAALRRLRAGGFSLAEINEHVNDPRVVNATGPNGRRFRLLSDELDAGNHAVHAALQEDEDARDVAAERPMSATEQSLARWKAGHRTLADVLDGEKRARSINKGRAIAKVLR